MKTVIAMSGGVDSSVTAFLCKNAGYECKAVTLMLHNSEDSCCTNKDILDAKAVAERLLIPFEILDCTDGFKEKVIDKFILSYEQGFTPNPCIDCNREIKFKKLYEKMYEIGYSHIATGHYARIEEKNGRYYLKKALDASKDQSYVLYSLTQNELSHTLFPLGEYTKSEARKVALQNGLLNAEKHDSQDICFIPDGDYASFIEKATNKTYESGNFVTKDGKVLGQHKGIIRYTIGQRKGLGLALPSPMYVCRKNLETNEVVLCSNDELFETTLYAKNFNWIAFEKPPKKLTALAKVRYAHKEQPAEIEVNDDGIVKVTFFEPQRAFAKGQAVVLYDGDTVLGGGTII